MRWIWDTSLLSPSHTVWINTEDIVIIKASAEAACVYSSGRQTESVGAKSEGGETWTSLVFTSQTFCQKASREKALQTHRVSSHCRRRWQNLCLLITLKLLAQSAAQSVGNQSQNPEALLKSFVFIAAHVMQIFHLMMIIFMNI